MTPEAWFADAADAKKYVGEVGRLWVVWLLGLIALLRSTGGLAFAVAGALLVAMFILMQPLQHRVHELFEDDSDGRHVPPRQTLSSRDKALRELTYGRGAFAEAISKAAWWRPLAAIPWVVIVLTIAAGAAIAVEWLSG